MNLDRDPGIDTSDTHIKRAAYEGNAYNPSPSKRHSVGNGSFIAQFGLGHSRQFHPVLIEAVTSAFIAVVPQAKEKPC